MTNHSVAIDSKCNGLSDVAALQNRILEIDPDVLECRSLVGFDPGVGVFPKPGEHVGFYVVFEKLYGALFELEDANHGIGNDFNNDSVEFRRAVPVGPI